MPTAAPSCAQGRSAPPPSLLARRGGLRVLHVQPSGRDQPAHFEELYRHWHDALLSFCARRLRSPQDAEDATQEAMVRVYQRLSGGAPIENLPAFLFTTARNVCIDRARARPSSATQFDEELDAPAPACEEARDHRVELEAVLGDMRWLSERQRRALVLRAWHGLSYERIAEILQTSAESCRSLISEARQVLAERRAGRELDCSHFEALRRATARPRRHHRLQAHVEHCSRCTFAPSLPRAAALAPAPLLGRLFHWLHRAHHGLRPPAGGLGSLGAALAPLALVAAIAATGAPGAGRHAHPVVGHQRSSAARVRSSSSAAGAPSAGGRRSSRAPGAGSAAVPHHRLRPTGVIVGLATPARARPSAATGAPAIAPSPRPDTTSSAAPLAPRPRRPIAAAVKVVLGLAGQATGAAARLSPGPAVTQAAASVAAVGSSLEHTVTSSAAVLGAAQVAPSPAPLGALGRPAA